MFPMRVVLAIAGAVAIGGCGYKGPLTLKPRPDSIRKTPTVVMPEPAPDRPVPSEAVPPPK